MECRFYYNGKVFTSELQLDDYLILLKALKESLDDRTYSLVINSKGDKASAKQELYHTNLLKNTKKYIELRNKGFLLDIEIREKGEDPDLDSVSVTGSGYKSVTDLIHSYRFIGEDGEEHPLFPIFDEDNYWEEKFKDYKNGNFDPYELQFIDDLVPKDSTGKPLRGITDEKLNAIRKRMTNVWSQLSKIGSAIHSIANAYFSVLDWNSKDHKRVYEITDDEELKRVIADKLKKDENFKKYITPKILDDTIKLCRKSHDEIKKIYGEKAIILTEFGIVSEANFSKQERGLVAGKIDLLVIGDKEHNERIGILDFKCSPKDFTESNPTDNPDPFKYNQAKIRTFKYLLATYRKMVENIIPTPQEADLYIIPWKFEGFKSDDEGNVSFEGLSSLNESLHKLDNSSFSEGGDSYNNIESHLLKIFPRSEFFNNDILTSGNVLENIKTQEKYMFPKGLQRVYTDKEMAEDIAKYTKKKGNYWEYKKYIGQNPIKIKGTEEEAKAKILQVLQEKQEKNENYVRSTTDSLRKEIIEILKINEGQQEIHALSFKSYKSSLKNEDALYFQNKIKKYLNPYNYEVVLDSKRDPIMNELGILMFRNKHNGLIDIIKISRTSDFRKEIKFKGNRTNLMGNFISDEEASKEKQIMLATVGNAELMEAMAFLNQLSDSPLLLNENSAIGTIEVINPSILKGITASNEQLLYNYTRLNSLAEKANNVKMGMNFHTNENENGIKMATFVDVVTRDFQELTLFRNADDKSIYYRLNGEIKNKAASILQGMENGYNPETLKLELIDLKNQLEDHYDHLKSGKANYNIEDNPEYKLHQDILFAIAELSGVKLYQQLDDHAKFKLSRKGLEGTLIDNPGTMGSPILNTFTDKVAEAYLKTRDKVIDFNLELRKRVEKLKKEKGFGLGKQYIAGNQVTDLYDNMYDKTKTYEDGEMAMIFKDPFDNNNDLEPAEREFLIYAVWQFNLNRGEKINSEQDLKDLIEKNPDKALQAPLVKGGLASAVNAKGGWLNYIKYRFKLLSPSSIYERTKEEMKGLLDDSGDNKLEKEIRNGEKWEATNRMRAIDENFELRKKFITNEDLGGEAYFEHNVETLLLEHKNAYVMEEELNKIFPTLRALMMHLNNQAAIMNENFSRDVEYIVNYVQSKIHGISLDLTDNDVSLLMKKGIREGMQLASKLALAFNPKQAYQFIDGIIKDVMIYIKYQNNLGGEFKAKDLLEAWKFVMKDIFHYGNEFTQCELINQLYGINDMDVNSYIDRIKTDNTGLLYNFWNVGFRFASRPDYYNRMTIFGAQMRADGSWKAHKMVDGKLVYDWTEDERFKAFAKNDKSNMAEYNRCKTNYITIMKQMIDEGVTDKDGNPLELRLGDGQIPMEVPKAYSNKLSESMKAFADRIYGYYAHEKKSMISSYYLGSLFMQMATYWSAKKNQYLQKRTYTQEGHYEDYEEDGVKYYWELDKNGDMQMTTRNTGLPVLIWKGRPQEGIVITLLNLINGIRGKEGDVKGIEKFLDMWNEPDNELRRLYRANTKLLIYDLGMVFVMGKLVAAPLQKFAKDFSKPSNIDSFGEASAATGISLFSDMLDSALDDANAWDSIVYDKGFRWTPFSLQTIDRLFGNFKRLITGDMDFYDFLIKFSAAGRLTEPVWNYVKQQVFDTKIGQSLYGLNRE